MTGMTLEARVIRHGDKYPSTHPDPALANQLTEEGKIQANSFGAFLAESWYDYLVIVTSEEDRAIMTGAEIQQGYGSASYIQTESLLRQDAPDRMRQDLKKGLITRAALMEQCYTMVRPEALGNADEVKVMKDAAERYLSVALQYIQVQRLPEQVQTALESAKKPIAVLVGHDPHIGGVEQLLESRADLKEVRPLGGVRLIPKTGHVTYSFRNRAIQYTGIVPAELG